MDLTPTPDAPSDPPPAAPGDTGQGDRSQASPQATAVRSRPLNAPGGNASRSPHEIGGKKFRVGAGDTYVPRKRIKRRRRMIAGSIAGVLLLGAGAYGVDLLVIPKSTSHSASSCSSSSASRQAAAAAAAAAKVPTASQVTVNVYNSTQRQGLAASTANLLKQRGFTIGSIANDPLKANLAVAAQIRGGKAGTEAMKVLAAEVTGAQLMFDSRPDTSVDLVLGAAFSALASPAQVTAVISGLQSAAAASVHTTGCG